MFGHSSPRTFRIKGKIHNRDNTILIDSDSTQNFIQECIACFLNLSLTPTHPLNVMIGKVNKLNCNTQCLTVPVCLNNSRFIVDFFILPINGADVVLGIQWLKTLAPIVFDFSTLQMQFMWNNTQVCLQCLSETLAEVPCS